MYHVHITDITFFTIEKIHYYMGSFPFLIFTLLTCAVYLFLLCILYITIYMVYSCIIFFPIVILSLIKWLINYLTVKLIDDCYNAYSARIAFFFKLSNSKPSRTKLSRINALFVPSSEQHYCKHDFKLVVWHNILQILHCSIFIACKLRINRQTSTVFVQSPNTV